VRGDRRRIPPRFRLLDWDRSRFDNRIGLAQRATTYNAFLVAEVSAPPDRNTSHAKFADTWLYHCSKGQIDSSPRSNLLIVSHHSPTNSGLIGGRAWSATGRIEKSSARSGRSPNLADQSAPAVQEPGLSRAGEGFSISAPTPAARAHRFEFSDAPTCHWPNIFSFDHGNGASFTPAMPSDLHYCSDAVF